MQVTMLNGLPVTMLNGMPLGCACQDKGIGAVVDYDIITIGGTRFSVNQIIDKKLIATRNTNVYSSGFDTSKPKYQVRAGETIGKVTSYLLPRAGRSNTWLEVQTSAGYFYVPNESVSGSVTTLKEQGAATVAQEIKKEQDQAQKEKDPLGYYIKTYAIPVLIGGGLIYLAATYGKEVIKAKLTKTK